MNHASLTAKAARSPGQPGSAVVTGASGGLGSALVRTLLARGYRVVGVDQNVGRMERLRAALGVEGFCPVIHDLQDPELASAVLANLSAEEPVTALVCVAAVSVGDQIDRLKDEDWAHSFAVNTTPAMVLARALIPLMKKAGGGSIVNVGSPVGVVGARKPSYAASKAALHGLTMSLARNLGPLNIRANLFLPGPMITPMTEDWSEEKREAVASGSFLGRLCDPMEAAACIAFLLSDEASYVTGSVFDATGGSMLGH